MRDRYLKNAIEAALLAAGHPVPLEQLLEMFGERDRPEPAEIRAALEPNLCRCGTHMRILAAVRRAGELMQSAGAPASDGRAG